MQANLLKLPPVMRDAKRWINYRLVPQPSGKSHKEPVRGGRLIDALDPRNWLTLQQALARSPYVGFVLGDGIAGGDIDNLQTLVADNDTAWVDEALLHARDDGCYAEKSVSGNGLHIIGRMQGAYLGGCAGNSAEFYMDKRWFAMTGDFVFLPKQLGTIDRAAKVFEKRIGQRNAPAAVPKPRRGDVSLPEVAAQLKLIDPACGYDRWYRIGFALKHEFGDAGFEVWRDWSLRSSAHKETDESLLRKWRQLRPDGRYTVASIFYEANLSKIAERKVRIKRLKELRA